MKNVNEIIEILNENQIKILGLVEKNGITAIVVPKWATDTKIDFSGLDPEYKREFAKDWMPSGAPFLVRNYFVNGVFITSNGIVDQDYYKCDIEEIKENWHGRGDVSELSDACLEIHHRYETRVMKRKYRKKEEDERRRQRRFKYTTPESRLDQVLSIENLEISESEVKTLAYFLKDHLVEDVFVEVEGYKKLNATDCIFDVYPIVRKAKKRLVF